MTIDERSLFGDEQSYIAWKRQQEAEAKAEAYKAAQARQKRRKPKYGPRIMTALNTIKVSKHRTRVYSDAERYDAYKAKQAAYRREWRARNSEKERLYWQLEKERHGEDIKLARAVYRNDHRDEINARRRAQRAAKKAAQQQQDDANR
jgi:hypothetical protein